MIDLIDQFILYLWRSEPEPWAQLDSLMFLEPLCSGLQQMWALPQSENLKKDKKGWRLVSSMSCNYLWLCYHTAIRCSSKICVSSSGWQPDCLGICLPFPSINAHNINTIKTKWVTSASALELFNRVSPQPNLHLPLPGLLLFGQLSLLRRFSSSWYERVHHGPSGRDTESLRINAKSQVGNCSRPMIMIPSSLVDTNWI